MPSFHPSRPARGRWSPSVTFVALLPLVLLGAAFFFPVRHVAAAGDQDAQAPLPALEIRGRLLSPAGAAVAGVTVELRGREPARREAVTDQDGRFRFAVRDGWYSLRAEGPDAETGDLAPPVRVHGASRDVELRLQGVVLHGRLSGLSPAELAEAKVHASVTKYDRYLDAAVDAEGRYRIAGLAAGDWHVWAASGMKRLDRHLSVGPGDDEHTVDFAFPRFFRVRGRVVGAGGRPIAPDQLSFDGPLGSDVLGDWASVVLVDRRGRFSTLLPKGSYRVDGEVSHPFGERFGRRPLVVAGAARAGLVVRLDAKGTISGRLLGVQDRYVMVQAEQGNLSQFGTVDGEGRYRITGLPGGDWELAAWSCSRTVRATVRLPSSDARAVLDLPFGAGGLTLSGRLTELDPVAHYTVKVCSKGLCVSAAAGADGTFLLSGLIPQSYRIEVNDDDMPVVAKWPLYKGEIDVQADRQVTLPLAFPP